jgi:hypothetical protein
MKGASMSIGRFLIGSSLVFVGWMLMLSAAITVVGLPIGLAVLAAGLELMLAPRSGRGTGKPGEGIQLTKEGR